MELNVTAKPKVLIVDDNAANLRAFEAILESLQVEIISVGSGHEALGCLLQNDFAVILLDVRMPVMDGLETAALIRRRGRAQFTPIIFISAYEKTPLEVAEGYLAGAIDYLFSPVSPDTLRRKVSAFVDLYRKNSLVKGEVEELHRINTSLREQIIRLEKQVHELQHEGPRVADTTTTWST